MLALQKICEKERLSVLDMLTVLKKMKGNYMAEKARLRCLTMAEKMKAGSLKAQKEFLHKFLPDLTPNEGVEHYLTGKRVCIDMDFQKNHFNCIICSKIRFEITLYFSVPDTPSVSLLSSSALTGFRSKFNFLSKVCAF
jgi:hypothetical protein